jgi:hypothetical protein
LDPVRFEPHPKWRIDDLDVFLCERAYQVTDLVAGQSGGGWFGGDLEQRGGCRKPSSVMVRTIEAGLGEDPGAGMLLGRGRFRRRILLGHNVFDPVARSRLRPAWRR